MKNAIITGPTGGIGIALIDKLISQNVRVFAVCRPNSKRIADIPNSNLVEIISLELNEIDKLPSEIEKLAESKNISTVKKTQEGIQLEECVFYHFGWDGTFGADARNNVEGQILNVKYTVMALEAAAKVGCEKFVGAGSQAEYGRFEGKLCATTPAFPENGYGIAKLAAGQMSRLRASQLGIEHVWTRILSVYGPNDGAQTMVKATINKLLDGEKPSFTKGEQKWDYLYSKDAANAMYLIGEKGVDGKVYCIGSGQVRELRQYIEEIKEAVVEYKNKTTDSAEKLDSKAIELGFGDVPYGDKQVMYLQADISELTKDTGFVPEYSFEEGIRETVELHASILNG